MFVSERIRIRASASLERPALGRRDPLELLVARAARRRPTACRRARGRGSGGRRRRAPPRRSPGPAARRRRPTRSGRSGPPAARASSARSPSPARSTLGSLIAPIPSASVSQSRARRDRARRSPSPSAARGRASRRSARGGSEQASTLPSRIATGWPSQLASTSTPAPQRSIQGARMKTARSGSSPTPSKSSSASKLCSWRPNALRRAVASIRPRWSRVADDHPRAGAEDRRAALGVRADRRLEAVALDRLRDRRALAAGDDEPVEARRGRPASGPRPPRRRARAGSARGRRSPPWEARTPIRSGRLGAPAGTTSRVAEQLALGGELGDVVAAHRLAEVGRGGEERARGR